MPNSYRVMVLAYGETDYVGNGIRYATIEEARKEADDLFCRWTAVKSTKVEESEDAPTQPVSKSKAGEERPGAAQTSMLQVWQETGTAWR